MVRLDCICAPLIICIQALGVLYLSMHRTKVSRLPNWKFLLLIPALVYAAVYSLLYYLLGFDNAAYINKVFDETGELPTNLSLDLVFMYNLFGEVLIDIYSFTMSVVMLWQCVTISRRDGYKFGGVYRFFFKGAQTTQSRAISFLYITTIVLLMPMIIFGRAYMMNNPILGATLTVLIAIVFHFLCHVEFFGENAIVTLHELSHIQSSETFTNIITGTPDANETPAEPQPTKAETQIAEPKSPAEPVAVVKPEPIAEPAPVSEPISKPELVSEPEPMPEPTVVEKTEIAADDKQEPAAKKHTEKSVQEDKSHVSMAKFDVLAQHLEELMESEHLYREESLTLAFLSERLGVGRTMISTMINNVYGISFRDYVSKYRINAAKKYMLANPNATQEAVAFECGFKDASSLNHKFKEAEGVTPLMWLTRQPK